MRNAVVALVILVLTNITPDDSHIARAQVLTSDDLQCSPGWSKVDDQCYLLYSFTRSWDGALAICHSHGAQLATIHDSPTNMAVLSLAQMQSLSSYWIGMNRKSNVSNVTSASWSSGASVSLYEGFWADEQPDTESGSCVYVSATSQGLWSLGTCEWKRSFVCQQPVCPRGSFRCARGGCVNSRWRCDGVDDCGDFSDERDCSLNCSRLMEGTSGEVVSPGWPSPYPGLSNCIWTIRVPVGTNVRLQFLNFSTEAERDELLVLGGGSTEMMSLPLGRLSGTPSPPLPEFTSPNNFLILRFFSDDQSQLSGFRAQYNSVSAGSPDSGRLVQVSSDMATEVTSPLYPSPYLGSQENLWIISAQQPRTVLTLQSLDVDLAPGDVIHVRDGGDANAPLLATYTSSGGPQYVMSTGSQLYLLLRTGLNAGLRNKGFRFQIREGCDVTLDASHGEVASPGYGVVSYPSLQQCTWRIRHQPMDSRPSRLTLAFRPEFHLENNKDFLKVYEGANSSGRALHAGSGFTGSVAPGVLASDSGELFLHFQSDSIFNYKGFSASFSRGCPVPSFNANTRTSINVTSLGGYDVGMRFNVSCDEGYSFQSEEGYVRQADGSLAMRPYMTLECLQGGTWNVRRIPQCIPNYCGTPPPIAMGYVESATGATYGSSATYACQEGTTLQGPATIQCQSSGLWQTPPACIAASCPALSPVANASMATVLGDGRQAGSILRYTCNHGYELLGVPILLCLSNGSWSHPQPSCTGVRCLVPEVSRGQLQGSSPGSLVVLGTSLQLQCDQGFTPSTSPNLACLPDQTFSAPALCVDEDECQRAVFPCQPTQDCLNTEGSFMCVCKAGYRPGNTPSQPCQNVDECAVGNGGCTHTCTDSPGSYSCSCPSGYTIFTGNGSLGYVIPSTETGLRAGDIYHLRHTCVRVSCPAPSAVDNGYSTRQPGQGYQGLATSGHYFQDRLTFHCRLGYVLQGSSILTCLETGQWSAAPPSCVPATCPQDSRAGAVNLARVSPSGSVPYLGFLNLTCSVPGRGTFLRQRQCLYDASTGTYRLHGPGYDCGVLDCGVPETSETSAGMVTPTLTQTQYGASFTFACNQFYSLAGSSSHGNTTVTCEGDGYWGFGDLRCVPMTCPWPGVPPDGMVTVSGYDVGSVANYSCSRSGFRPQPAAPLLCQAGGTGNELVWNGTTPVCVDMEPPTLSPCPDPRLSVSRYSAPMFPEPQPGDNSGYWASFSVTPQYFKPSTPLINDTDVTYRVTDHAGLVTSCSVSIQIEDNMPPTIQCPPARTEVFPSEGATYFERFSPSLVTYSDNSGSATVTFSPPFLNLTIASADSARAITATATDLSNNSVSCSFVISFAAETCLPSRIQAPVDGVKNCSAKPGGAGFQCRFQCNPGFYFYDFQPNGVVESECSTGGNWSTPYIPSCVVESAHGYEVSVQMTYVTNASVALTTNCSTQYRDLLNSRLRSLDSALTARCFGTDVTSVRVDTTSIVVAYENTTRSFNASFRMELNPYGMNYDQYARCVDPLAFQFLRVRNQESMLTSLHSLSISGCPVFYAPSVQPQGRRSCSSSFKARFQSNSIICLACPPGNFKNVSSGQCQPCPRGTYQFYSDREECLPCPSGQVTRQPGQTRPESCIDQCGGELVSISDPEGLPPCDVCPANSFRQNSTSCLPCPPNTLYTGRNNPLHANCTSNCRYEQQAGRRVTNRAINLIGSLESCQRACDNYVFHNRPCLGFSFSRGLCSLFVVAGSETADPTYDLYRRICSDVDQIECFCAAQCQAGYVSRTGYEPDCRPCPQGLFSAQPGSSQCSPCPSNQTTQAPGGTSCVPAAPIFCPSRCANGGTCKIIDHRAVCDCAPGFEGDNCQTVKNFCQSDPCYNNATCRNTPTSFTCTCRTGTSGDRCEVIADQCTPTTCLNDGLCYTRVDAGAVCACQTGFSGPRCELQTPVCQLRPCLNSAQCNPVNPYYRKCQCQPGFAGQNCSLDLDECASSPCRHGGTCTDGVNGFSCRCRPGFMGAMCQTPVQTCAQTSCGAESACFNDQDSGLPRCVCPAPTSLGTYCQYRISVNAEVANGTGNAEIANMTAAACVQRCDVINSGVGRCQAVTYDRTRRVCRVYVNVVSTATSVNKDLYLYECQHPTDDFYTPWYNLDSPGDGTERETLTALQNRGVQDVCSGEPVLGVECAAANGSSLDPSIPCSVEGAVCVGASCPDIKVRYKCSVTKVLRGRSCVPVDLCNPVNPCQNGGFCVTERGSFRCQCFGAYEGARCQHRRDYCASRPCQNNGTCTSLASSFSCACPQGFAGTLCETNVDDCSSSPCDGGVGSLGCVDLVNDFRCTCRPGYTGKNCSVEVDECASMPCLHGGSCRDDIGRHVCECAAGYNGSRCETVIDRCQAQNPCQNSGQCHTLLGGAYCSCRGNAYGPQCQNVQELCVRVQPCSPPSSCLENTTSTQCVCPPGVTGPGCRLFVDYDCSSQVCENGGSCQLADSGGVRCVCPPGFSGTRCQVNEDDCANATCPPTARCLDGVNQHFCLCPLGKALPDCTRDLDRNYDLCFLPSVTGGSAALPYTLPLDNVTALTLTLWVKFKVVGSTGTFVTVSGSQSGQPRVLRLDERGVTLNVTGVEGFLPFRYFPVNDGLWNNVVVTWSSASGTVHLYVNSIRHGTLTGYGLGSSLPVSRLHVSLGTQTRGSQAFQGCVSQVSLYSAELDFVQDVPGLLNSPDLLLPTQQLLLWSGYVTSGSTRVARPSSARKSSCPAGFIDPPACKTPVQDKAKPSVASCPDNLYQASAGDATPVTWTPPVFSGASHVSSTHRPGDVLAVGAYSVVYQARDDDGNVALCSFRIYINTAFCPRLVVPRVDGSQNCSQVTGAWRFTACRMVCPAPSRSLTEPVPRFFSCGPTGHWSSLDYFQGLYPACGEPQEQARVAVTAQLTYQAKASTCTAIRATLQQELLASLTRLHLQAGSGLCGQTSASCNNTGVTVDCDPQLSTQARITIPSASPQVTVQGERLTVEQLLLRAIQDQKMFDYPDKIVGGVSDPQLLQLTLTPGCPDGQVLLEDICVKCGPGTFYNATSRQCANCPRGHYQPGYGMLSCLPCTAGLTTPSVGTVQSSECVTSCQAGSYYNVTRGSCMPCAVGTYQEQPGTISCLPCPLGKVTRLPGASNGSLCVDGCSSGYELEADGGCRPCAVGTYRAAGQGQVCQSCPPDLITPAPAAVSPANCTVVACPAGQFRNASNQCQLCPSGSYQDLQWQDSCKSCGGDRYRTDSPGATNPSQCRFFCPSGLEAVSTTCRACPVGTYKDNAVNVYGVCLPCPGNKLTPSSSATSLSNCTILQCPAGYRANSTQDVCERCPLNSYQPLANQPSCLPCPADTGTREPGANSSSLCEAYCPEGQEKVGVACRPCPQGTYKSHAPQDFYFSACTACPPGFTTPGDSSSAPSACSVRNCSAGYKVVSGAAGDVCEACPQGSYQPLPLQSACQDCPPNTTTAANASTDLAQCRNFCQSGLELVGGQCRPCARGTYKDNSLDPFSGCVACPPDFTTPTDASTSLAACSQRNCSAGSFRNASELCEPCAQGSYQPQPWQTACLPCPQDSTTRGTGAANISQCFLSCPPGKESRAVVCQDCGLGHYKDVVGISPCSPCPPGLRANVTGATSPSQCTVPACPPGQYLTGGSCQPCPHGQYQPASWQPACLPCPPGNTTLQPGSTSLSQCVVDCPAGSQYQMTSGQCQLCPRGSHRDGRSPALWQCQPCPPDTLTPGPGAVLAVACSQPNCTQPGFFLNVTSNQCQACGLGTFNSQWWAEQCQPCPPGTTTSATGAPSNASCIPDCLSGQELDSSGRRCQACPPGSYRDRASSSSCLPCPQSFTTEGGGATSLQGCSVPLCAVGAYYEEARGSCLPCPVASYQPLPNQRSCRPCPGFQTTRQTGATSSSECQSQCQVRPLTCTSNAHCQDTAQGPRCVCDDNFQGNGNACTHVCDTGPYCLNGGTCVKNNPSPCTCPESYIGPLCEERIASPQLLQLILGVSFGLLGFFLLLISIICCACFLRRKRRRHYPESDKSSIYSNGKPQPRQVSFMVPAINTQPYRSLAPPSLASTDPAVFYSGSAANSERSYVSPGPALNGRTTKV